MDAASQHAQLEDRNIPAGCREETRVWPVTYAVSVRRHVGGAPVVGVRGGRAAPAGGRRVGRRSGNDHVEGHVPGLEITTATVTKAQKGGAAAVPSTWGHL